MCKFFLLHLTDESQFELIYFTVSPVHRDLQKVLYTWKLPEKYLNFALSKGEEPWSAGLTVIFIYFFKYSVYITLQINAPEPQKDPQNHRKQSIDTEEYAGVEEGQQAAQSQQPSKDIQKQIKNAFKLKVRTTISSHPCFRQVYV